MSSARLTLTCTVRANDVFRITEMSGHPPVIAGVGAAVRGVEQWKKVWWSLGSWRMNARGGGGWGDMGGEPGTWRGLRGLRE